MTMRARLSSILSLVLLFAVITGCEEVKKLLTGSSVDLAKKRVTKILDGSVGGKEDQRAISQYYKGVDLITGPLLETAYDDFNRWMAQKDLTRKIRTWEILDAEQLPKEGAQPDTVLVTVKINGSTYKMKVPDRQPITWAR